MPASDEHESDSNEKTEDPVNPFFAWDPQSLGVVTIILGIFQIFLSILFQFGKIHRILTYNVPLNLGIMNILSGSICLISEKRPSRGKLKICCATNALGFLLCPVGFVSYSLSIPQLVDCSDFENSTHCEHERLLKLLLSSILGHFIILNSVALVSQGLIFLSTVRGLRAMPRN